MCEGGGAFSGANVPGKWQKVLPSRPPREARGDGRGVTPWAKPYPDWSRAVRGFHVRV